MKIAIVLFVATTLVPVCVAQQGTQMQQSTTPAATKPATKSSSVHHKRRKPKPKTNTSSEASPMHPPGNQVGAHKEPQ